MRTQLIAIPVLAILACLSLPACSTPEQIQNRKLKKLEDRREISLGYVGSCQMQSAALANTCVDFYANINTTMKKFALKNCTVVDGPCDRMQTTHVCLSPAERGTALIQYEFVFPAGMDAAAMEKECNPAKKRELVQL